MRTIGFVDYYISEWHANNYPVWIDEICKKNGRSFEVKYVWAEEEISPLDGKSTQEWCDEFGAEKCNTIEELCSKSDYILVLAPSNPEKHLQYAKEVLKCGKNTYIDKTFAQDYNEAKEIFDIAEKNGAKIFSSSALRYAVELDEITDASAVITTGGGSNIGEYIIHQIEMTVKSINEAPLAVKVENQGSQYICNVKFEGDKKGTMIFAQSMPFTICADTEEGTIYKAVASDYFKGLIADILRFYETGEASFDTAQTLNALKIRGGIIKAIEMPGEWINV